MKGICTEGRSHVIYSSLQIYEAAQELPSNIRFFLKSWKERYETLNVW